MSSQFYIRSAAGITRLVLCTLVVSLFAILNSPFASAQTASSQPTTQPTTTTKASKPASTTQADEEEEEKHFAVINGIVHTVTGPVLDGATVLCKDGRIVEIGADVKLPDECEVVDAEGRHVYPGLVAAAASGIHGNPPEDATNVFGLSNSTEWPSSQATSAMC